MVNVRKEIQDNVSLEIDEGLAQGDEVITAPYNGISRMFQYTMLTRKLAFIRQNNHGGQFV